MRGKGGATAEMGCKAEAEAVGYMWIVGMLCSIVSSIGATIGLLIQKRAQTLQQQAAKKSRTFGGFILSPLWFLGFFFLVIVPLPFDVTAMATASQSLVTPLGGVTIVCGQVRCARMCGD